MRRSYSPNSVDLMKSNPNPDREHDPMKALTTRNIELAQQVDTLRARVAELEAALGAALDPLDLYHAYGWQDRNGVRASLRRLLNH